MVPRLNIPGEKPIILYKNFGKTMQIFVLERMLEKARVNVSEVYDQPQLFPSATDKGFTQ